MNKAIWHILILVLLSTCLSGQKISPEKLTQLITQAEQTNSEAIILFKDGELVLESYFGIGHPDTLIETMSCTKSIVALAALAMMEDGFIDSLETPIYHFYPEWNQGNKKEVSILHLLNMTSGIQNNPNAGVEIYPSPDFVKLALAAELSNHPGEVFNYNNKALNLMAGVIKQVTSERMDKYISRRIFEPLGIKHVAWTLDQAGNPHVMSGCQIKPIDFAKIGLLVLNNGIYNDKQILQVNSIQRILHPTAQNKGYGLLWWLSYEQIKYTVDDQIIQELKLAGASDSLLADLGKLLGSYDGFPAFKAQLEAVFGTNYNSYLQQHIPENASIRKKEFIGSPIGYNANGYLGNYLVIVPEQNLVAVRMISHNSFDWDADISNSFFNFEKLVLGLGK